MKAYDERVSITLKGKFTKVSWRALVDFGTVS